MNTHILKIEARGTDSELWIYAEITPGFASSVVREIGNAKSVVVRINSPGGSVTDGLAIYNALLRHPGDVTVYIDGLAASIASLIAMAGDHVVMAQNALVMIHEPWISTAGSATDLRETADVLDRHRDAMVSAYATKSGKTPDEIIAIMRAETWFDAPEALAEGFIDEIANPLAVAASCDLSLFPKALSKRNHNMSEHITLAPDNVVAIEAAAKERAHAAIQARNSDVRGAFKPYLAHAGVQALLDSIVDNPAITLDQARAQLLVKLGEGSEPLHPQGYAPRVESYVGSGRNDHHGEFRAAVVDSILARFSVPVKDPHPAVRDVRGMSAPDICATLLSQRGTITRGMSKSELVQAALSTSDLPSLLENIASKSVMTGFRENEAASHRRWVREGELADFKTSKRVALSEAPGLLEVLELGEYKHGALTDAAESIVLATYGRIVAISRQALVNDDLQEIARLPYAMGQAAARTEAGLVYSLLTSNPVMRDSVALFDASHGNVGTPAVLSNASLGEARALMRLQRGLAGEATLNIVPRFLLVPAALETEAEMVMAAMTPATTANVIPDWIKTLEVVVDSRLDADSETAWYLAAAPVSFDTVEVARLNGQGAEVITREGFNVDSAEFKVRLDVGAAVLDWRGLVYNAGV